MNSSSVNSFHRGIGRIENLAVSSSVILVTRLTKTRQDRRRCFREMHPSSPTSFEILESMAQSLNTPPR